MCVDITPYLTFKGDIYSFIKIWTVFDAVVMSPLVLLKKYKNM